MKRTIVIALIVVCMMFGVVAYATEATTSAGPVNVSVTANPKLTLTLDTTIVTFPSVDPGTPVTISDAVKVTVKSNTTWGLTAAVADASLIGLSRGGVGATKLPLAGLAAQAKTSGTTYGDDYTINLPWSYTPGTFTNIASVTYTAVNP